MGVKCKPSSLSNSGLSFDERMNGGSVYAIAKGTLSSRNLGREYNLRKIG